MYKYLLILLTGLLSMGARAQKVFSEGIVTYKITVLDAKDKAMAEAAFKDASQMLSVKGYKARYEFLSPLRSNTVLYDANAKSATLLRQNGQERYMTDFDAVQWADFNARYANLRFEPTGENKVVAGFGCIGAKAMMADGSEIIVFYANDLQPLARGYDYAFAGIEGLPLEFTVSNSGTILQYSATSVQQTIISATKFEKPKTGYKILEYKSKQ